MLWFYSSSLTDTNRSRQNVLYSWRTLQDMSWGCFRMGLPQNWGNRINPQCLILGRKCQGTVSSTLTLLSCIVTPNPSTDFYHFTFFLKHWRVPLWTTCSFFILRRIFKNAGCLTLQSEFKKTVPFWILHSSVYVLGNGSIHQVYKTTNNIHADGWTPEIAQLLVGKTTLNYVLEALVQHWAHHTGLSWMKNKTRFLLLHHKFVEVYPLSPVIWGIQLQNSILQRRAKQSTSQAEDTGGFTCSWGALKMQNATTAGQFNTIFWAVHSTTLPRHENQRQQRRCRENWTGTGGCRRSGCCHPQSRGGCREKHKPCFSRHGQPKAVHRL